MRWYRRNIVTVMTALTFALALSSLSRAQDAPEMTNLKLPLELHENGKVKTQVTAGTAVVSEQGEIRAKDVKIEMFDEDGKLDAVVIAESCYVDREKEFVTSDTQIEFERHDLLITGRGFEWNGKEQTFKILHKAKVVFKSKAIDGLKRVQ
jgi:lipopolysaccharide export system protein LptC